MGMLNGASPSGPARGKSDAAGCAGADEVDLKHRLATTAVLLAFAVVAIAMATFAWFSIADSAKTRMLAMDATADGSLRFDLDAHDDFESYVHTLGFDAISSRISSDLGVDIDASKLEPVTTSDYETFTLLRMARLPRRQAARTWSSRCISSARRRWWCG